MTTVEEFAPAKVNLTLHVTGQRADGYHLLDSLVVFADVGDWVIAAPARELSLRITGPRAEGVPTDSSNLVLRAAMLMGAEATSLTLDKRLPAASGIGGGSADAAATLRALSQLHGTDLPAPENVLRLGADVPVCLQGRAVRMWGIGDRLTAVPTFPQLPAVLINPGVAVATPEVFRALPCRDNPAMTQMPETFDSPAHVSRWLATQRNDLEAPACTLAPVIAETLDALRSRPDCLLARMSGSGATCFGLFETTEAAKGAARALSEAYPDWWVESTTLA